MSENTNMDDLLDSSIDDLADMPEFAVYPAGVHKVIIDFEKKEVNKHRCVELKMKLIETLELANPDEEVPQAAGTEATVLFMLDNELGQGKLKDILRVLAPIVGTTKISDVLIAAKGMEVIVVTKVRQNKEKSQSYTDIVKMSVD